MHRLLQRLLSQGRQAYRLNMTTPGIRSMTLAVAVGLAGLSGTAMAALAKPTEAEAKAAAEKKAKADARSQQEKKELAASMQGVADRWRKNASEKGWTMHPPVPVDAVAGINAEAAMNKPSGQPGGQLGEAAKNAEIRSEKLGTAPASEDVKVVPKPEAAK